MQPRPAPLPHLPPGHTSHPMLQPHRLHLHALGFDLTWLPAEHLGCVLLHSLLSPLHWILTLLFRNYVLLFFSEDAVSKEKRTLGITAWTKQCSL